MAQEYTIIKSWQQISLRQFSDLLEMQEKEQDAKEYTRKAVEYLYGIDPMQIPYQVYIAMIAGMNQFFDKPLSEQKITRNGTYKLNGTTYVLDLRPDCFTTAQYMDFTAFGKEKGKTVDMLSAVLIPEGHKYNDGYDMEKAKQDIADMPAPDALGIINFFVSWSKASIDTILRFLTSRKVMKGMERTARRKLVKEVKRLSQAMASFPSC